MKHRAPALSCAVTVLSGLLMLARVEGEEHQFVTPRQPLPDKPWHLTFIDESRQTPEGQANAGAAWTDFFLERACANTLQTASPQVPWEQCSSFFSWAVWGYLSPDSKYHGDQRLITMSQVWLDALFRTLETKPEDPKLAEKWEPHRLDTWGFADYTLPLLEVEQRPELKGQIGAARVDRLREIVLDNIKRNTTPEAYNKLMGEAEVYINIITHPMAVYIHGWLLTGERRYLQMAHRIVHTLARDQLPNGMFPYRYRVYGARHQEYEMMYYHAMNLRGLYLYWWATGSREAEAAFRKAVPYYPLNLEPPYFFNDGPDIWWKDQWRTFWPHHIAMVAAVTGDGENATIANEMARHNVSHDRVDLFLAAHAYQQMGLKPVRPQPVRTDYVIEDPDIRGLRLRFGRWSSTFTTGSFTYTRTSAMRVADDLGGFTALHLARPYVRIAPLETAYRTEADYSSLGRDGADVVVAREGRAAAVTSTYSPALTAATWQPDQPIAPWQMTELWLMTDQGMLGLTVSLATRADQARELCHQFRFIIPGDREGQDLGTRTYRCGDLRLRVWDTDLAYTIAERARRYALAEHDRRDWQLSLSDTERSPEQVAQDPPPAGSPKPALLLPPMKGYPAGYRRFSLVEVSPGTAVGFSTARLIDRDKVLGIQATRGGKTYLALLNTGATGASYAMPPDGGKRLTIKLPPKAVALRLW